MSVSEKRAPGGPGKSSITAWLQNISRILMKIEANELKAVVISFFFVFTLMAAYYILRPVRDAMSSDWTDAELSWLWTSTFFISAFAVAVYGVAVSHIKFNHLVPGVYAFFAASFLAFYLGIQSVENPLYIDKAFYVWLSVFSLYHMSVFWSFMADIYSTGQSKRLFGLIATGASTGAIAGPFIPTFFADDLGTYNLMLIAIILLFAIIPVILLLQRLKITDLHREDVHVDLTGRQTIGGNPFAGFTDFFSHRYLLGIGLFILLYTAMSSYVYFELKNMLAEFDRATRSQYWGAMDLAVNSLAIVTAMFATSRLATRFGLAATLSLVPVIIMAGWLIVAISPVLGVLIGLQIVRRAGNYAITRPGREMLFTVVSRETRFKTKPVIDIVVYRGGDMLTAWTYTGLSQGLGLSLGPIAMIAAAIAVVWALVAVYLGKVYEHYQAGPEK